MRPGFSSRFLEGLVDLGAGWEESAGSQTLAKWPVQPQITKKLVHTHVDIL